MTAMSPRNKSNASLLMSSSSSTTTLTTPTPPSGRSRHYSTPHPTRSLFLSPVASSSCISTVDPHAVDDSNTSTIPSSQSPSLFDTLASLRLMVLSHLSDLEARLALLDLTDVGDVPARMGDARTNIIEHGRELLENLREDVTSYLPDFYVDFDNLALNARTTRAQLRAKLPDLGLGEMRAKLPDMPSMDNIRTRLSHLDLSLPDIGFPQPPLEYIPTLQARLHSLHTHLQDISFSIPSTSDKLPLPSLAPPKVLSDLLTDLLNTDLIKELLDDDELIDVEKEKAQQVEAQQVEAGQIQAAVICADEGRKLISFTDLPELWRNNEFILKGYRFIPLQSWPRLLLSTFMLHNEFLHIQSHLLPLLSILPLLQYLPSFIPSSFLSSSSNFGSSLQLPFSTLRVTNLVNLAQWQLFPPNSILVDPIPSTLFIVSASLCLFCSVIWHLMSGCADAHVMQTAARIDYIGIGWLISASVATVVYYGFQTHPHLLSVYISGTIITAIASSVLPFQAWFNERRSKKWRILFFLVLAFSAIFPLAHLAVQRGFWHTIDFIRPVSPSFLSYLIGLGFYATHFPECVFPGWFDYGGSHFIWHLFIVIAIRQHWQGLEGVKLSASAFASWE